MTAVVETNRPDLMGQLSLPLKGRPRRDFLRENREYLRSIQKTQKPSKLGPIKSPRLKQKLPDIRNDERKRAAASALDVHHVEPMKRRSRIPAAAITAERGKTFTEKRPGIFICRNNDTKKRLCAGQISPLMSDEFVQTCDIHDECFLDGARLLLPSEFILEEIRAKEPPPGLTVPPTSQPKAKSIKRKVDRHTCVLNAHLSDLKEFLEKGSVSRRKKNDIQKNPNIQKFLAKGRLNLLRRTSKPNFELGAKKTNASSHLMDSIKSTIVFGTQQTDTTSNRTAVKTKLTKIAKKEIIGDGPKRSDNKLIVVYQKR